MQEPIGVGVVGLGRRWRRYAPALAALRQRFRVRAVCDPLRLRAEREAKALGCRVAAGTADLLESADVEAVVLLGAGWQRLWPLELAARRGKPVLCAANLDTDLDAVGRLENSSAPLVLATPLRLAPVTGWLREAVKEQLGPIRMLLAEVCTPRRPRAMSALAALGVGTALLEWCRSFVDGEPDESVAWISPAGTCGSLHLSYPEGRTVSLRGGVTSGRPRLRVTVEAERGRAELTFPRRVAWSTPQGLMRLRLDAPAVGEKALLEHFAEVVRERKPPEPGLDIAIRALRHLVTSAKPAGAACG
jgi:predicted dehydrogenase